MLTIKLRVALLSLLLSCADLSAQYRGGAGGGAGSQSVMESSMQNEDMTKVYRGGPGGGADYSETEVSSAGLPLNLLSFTAKASQTSVQLNWTTEQERDTDHFSIERSSERSDFDVVGSIYASGQSLPGQRHAYTFTDHQPLPGTSYYRLRMVDYDGSFEYSDVQAVNIVVNSWTYSLYPNPARRGRFSLLFSNMKNTDTAKVTVLTGTGRVVHQQILTGKAGLRQTIIPPHLPTGSYFVRVQRHCGKQLTQKLIVID